MPLQELAGILAALVPRRPTTPSTAAPSETKQFISLRRKKKRKK